MYLNKNNLPLSFLLQRLMDIFQTYEIIRKTIFTWIRITGYEYE